MMFVVRSVRCSGPVRPKRSTVSVSSSPSRMDAAAPGCSSSSDQRLAADPRLTGTLIPEQEFFDAQSASRATLIDALAYLIAGIMALGSVFGALATIFTAVSRRAVEIATLRALGFHAVPVVISVLVEATVLALAGGILAAVAYAVLDGYTVSTLNPAAGSQLAFAFQVTPGSIRLGLGWAIAFGVIGGMVPAMRAARLPITTVLRDLSVPGADHHDSTTTGTIRGNPWRPGRKPPPSDSGLVAKGIHEHPRVVMTNSVCNSGPDSTRRPGPATERADGQTGSDSRRSPEPSRRCGVHRGMISSRIRISP